MTRRPCAALNTGTVQLDAHTAVMMLLEFLYISFPFGIATSATIRVGNLLGAGRPREARVAGRHAVWLDALMGTFRVIRCAAVCFRGKVHMGKHQAPTCTALAMICKCRSIRSCQIAWRAVTASLHRSSA